jgi:hypothetical protein
MSFNTKGYEVVKKTVSLDTIKFLYHYFLKKRDVAKILYESKYVTNNPTHMVGYWHKDDPQIPNTYSAYGDIAFDTLSEYMLPTVEKIVDMKLVPQYSFARIYKHGDELLKHKDRQESEIAATLFLGGDEWTIYMEGEPVSLKQGQMCVYKGCELEHWREKFLSEICVQVFIFYRPYEKDLKHDRRKILGLPPEFKTRTFFG